LLLAGHLLVYGRDQERPWIDSAHKKRRPPVTMTAAFLD
jgi:hypothetical protein